MKKDIFIAAISFGIAINSFGQQLGTNIQDAEKQGITIQQLDGIYKNAVSDDPSRSVFKGESEKNAMQDAYSKLLIDLSEFLSEHHFVWEEQVKCCSRIYFNTNGTIDYFLYNFPDLPEKKSPAGKEAEFNLMIKNFIKDYHFAIEIKEKFGQCSTATFGQKL